MSVHSSRGASWEAVRKAVLLRDGGICAYCGAEAGTVDHLLPKAKGGSDDPANLVACCTRCNSTKQDRVLLRMPYYNSRWLERL